MNNILVVEDDPRVADFLQRGLRAEGYGVQLARTGTEGLALARGGEPALLILDLMLPGISGLELCQTMRAEGHHVPVLMLTAMSSLEDKVNGLRLGADDYLTKPFAFAELIMRVKALLRRGPIARASVLRVADLEVDRLTQQVRRGGQRIELTAKEYGLLEYLAANPGRVFSRTMIIEHVWDQSFEGLTNIVDVYVRHLRSKIDDPFAVKLIRTVRGVGYGLGESPEA